MKNNDRLKAARKNKNDEFYTMRNEIENELKNYKQHFENKVVFCNCDDPRWSEFFIYFHKNFLKLGLKKLITTHYSINKTEDPSYQLVCTQYVLDEDGLPKPQQIPLTGDGDFRSEECIELLKQSDIVCTNPPFSLFREFVAQLIEYDKKFLIIGNNNAITYKEIFSLIKENKIWLGFNVNKTMEFKLADSYETWERIDEDGKKIGKVPAISWFTNLSHKKRNEKITLWKEYQSCDYESYFNFQAINVDRVNEIPYNYSGSMGVPITFLDKFNPDQFEIIGLGIASSGLEAGATPYLPEHKKYRKEIQKRGAVDGDLYIMREGEVVVPYARIIIKKRKEQNGN